MIRKYSLKAFLGIFVLLTFWFVAGQAVAAPTWYYCHVALAGLGGKGGTYLKLTDAGNPSEFADRVFRVPDAYAKEMLAIALTAASSSMKVFVYVDPWEGDYPEIISFYLAP